MEALVIKSSEWLRNTGNKNFRSGLYLDDKNCCMGIHMRQLGVSNSRLRSKAYPGNLNPPNMETTLSECRNVYLGPPTQLAGLGAELQGEIGGINDSNLTNDEEKISLLRPIFREKFGLEIDWRPNE